jgi:para-nitrobenzyl esterase
MATRLASNWAVFAATGNPQNDKVPAWEPYEQGKRTTMIFADEMRAEDDPRAQFRELWASIPAAAARPSASAGKRGSIEEAYTSPA